MIMTRRNKKKYILIISLACILTAVVGISFWKAIHSARNKIANAINTTLEEALHTDYYQQLTSDVYINTKKDDPKRKITKYHIITAEGDTTYHFKDSVQADSINYLIHQHYRANYSPINVNEINTIFTQKLAAIQLIKPNKEKAGIIYKHKGKTLYSGNDSLSYRQAAYCTPARFIDYPPSVEIQGWVDYRFTTFWQHISSLVWLVTIPYIVCMWALGLWYRKLIKDERKEKAMRQAVKDIRMDEKRLTCFIEGKSYKLAPLDFRLMKMFLEADGHFLTREDIKKEFWADISDKSADNNVNTHISNLRKMLQDHPYALEAYNKAGYRLAISIVNGYQLDA